MLLKIFKTNRVEVMFALPLVLLPLWLLGFFKLGVQDVTSSIGLYKLFFSNVNEAHWLAMLVAMLLVVVQAFYLNILLNKQAIYKQTNHYAALIYVLFSGFTVATIGFHPVIIANTFVVLALGKLLAMNARESAVSLVFDASFLIAIAALFYLPYGVLLLSIYAAIGLVRPFVWREWVVPIIGFLTPVLFYSTWCYVAEDDSWRSIFLDLSEFSLTSLFAVGWMNISVLVLFGILLIASILGLLKTRAVVTVRVKKLIGVLFLISCLFLVIFVLSGFNESTSYRYAILLLPISVLLPFYLGSAKRMALAGLLFYTLLALVVVNYFLNS